MKQDFLWAVAQMKQGKKVAYGNMCCSKYCYLDKHGIIRDDDGHEFNMIHIKSFEATDWEIVEDKKTLFDKAHSVPVESEEDYTFRGEDVKEHLKEFIESITRRFMCNLRKKARKERQG